MTTTAYIQRVDSPARSSSYPSKLEVLLGQLVNLLRDGVPVAHVQRRHHDSLQRSSWMRSAWTPHAARSSPSRATDDDFTTSEGQKKRTTPARLLRAVRAPDLSILPQGRRCYCRGGRSSWMGNRRGAVGEYDLSLSPTPPGYAPASSRVPALVEGRARDSAPSLTHSLSPRLTGDFPPSAAVPVLPSKDAGWTGLSSAPRHCGRHAQVPRPYARVLWGPHRRACSFFAPSLFRVGATTAKGRMAQLFRHVINKI